MSLSDSSSIISSEDEDSVGGTRSPPLRDSDSVLRGICVYLIITKTVPSMLMHYERHDGSPVVPGADWNQDVEDDVEQKAERDKAWHNFVHSLYRNTKKSVKSRRQHPKTAYEKHTNSLRYDYSPLDFLKPRRREVVPELPRWTTKHYESQFLPVHNMVSSPSLDRDGLKALLCQAAIGKANLLGVKTEVEGTSVDFYIEASCSNAGHFQFTVGGITVQGLRVPRGKLEGNKTLDIFSLSVINGDTSRPTSYVTAPFALGEDNRKLFCAVTVSTALQVVYAQARADRLGDGINEAWKYAEQTFWSELSNVPDKTMSLCIEVQGVSFQKGTLQDDELISFFPNGITSTLSVTDGEFEDPQGGMTTPYAVLGFDSALAISGRCDDLGKKLSKEEFLEQKLARMRISNDESKNYAASSASSSERAAHTPARYASSGRKNAPSKNAAVPSAAAAAASSNKKKSAKKTPVTKVASTFAPSSNKNKKKPTGAAGETRKKTPGTKVASTPAPSSNKNKKKSTVAAGETRKKTPVTKVASTPAPSSNKNKKKSTGAAGETRKKTPGTKVASTPAPNSNKNKKKSTVAAGAGETRKKTLGTKVASTPSSNKKKTAATPTPTLTALNGKGNESSQKKYFTPSVASTHNKKKIYSSDDDSSVKTETSEYVDNEGKRLVKNDAEMDGDCLFHSMNGNNATEDATELRESIGKFIIANFAHYNDAIPNLTEVLRQVLSPGEWAGQEVLQVFADMTGTVSVVFVADRSDEHTREFSPSVDDPNFESAHLTGQTRYLLYDDHTHYDWLLPADDESADEENIDTYEDTDASDMEEDTEVIEEEEDIEVIEEEEDTEVIEEEEDTEVIEEENDGADDTVGEEEESDADIFEESVQQEAEDFESLEVDRVESFPNIEDDSGDEDNADDVDATYSGSFEDEGVIPALLPARRQYASSPGASPREMFAAGFSAAQSAVSGMLGRIGGSPRSEDVLPRENLTEAFDNGRRRRKKTKIYDPS